MIGLEEERTSEIAQSEAVLSTGGLILAIALLMFSRVVALASFPVFDDAFITFRYGHNLATGHGFLYNPGAWVLGTTSPLFGLFSALIFTVGGSPETLIPVFNIALDVIILLLARRFLFPGAKTGFVLFWLFLCLSPMLARISVGGMEVNLFAVTTLSAFALYGGGRTRTASAVAALSYFLRPEAVVTVAVLCLWEVFGRKRPGRAIVLGLIAIAAVAPGLMAMQIIYGGFLPQSVIAKSHHVALPAWEVLKQLLAPEPVSAVFAIIGVLSLAVAARRGTVNGLLVLWFTFYVAAYAIAGPKIWSWYSFVPLLFCAVFAAHGLAAIVRRRLPAVWPRAGRYGVAALAGVIAAAWIGIGVVRTPDRITRNVYKPIEAFCDSHRHASDTVLAADIGVVGYYCPAFVYDTAGLVWPEALHYQTLGAIIAAEKPEYLLLNVDRTTFKMMNESPLDTEYRPLFRAAADRPPDPGKAANLTDDWVQAYIFYERLR